MSCVGSPRKSATLWQQVTCTRHNSKGKVIGRLPLFFRINVTSHNRYYYRSTGMGKSLVLKSEWVVE